VCLLPLVLLCCADVPCSTCVGVYIFEPSVVHFLKLLAEPELRYRYSTRVAEWEVGVLGVVRGVRMLVFFCIVSVHAVGYILN
jgi:hypothetical protein